MVSSLDWVPQTYYWIRVCPASNRVAVQVCCRTEAPAMVGWKLRLSPGAGIFARTGAKKKLHPTGSSQSTSRQVQAGKTLSICLSQVCVGIWQGLSYSCVDLVFASGCVSFCFDSPSRMFLGLCYIGCRLVAPHHARTGIVVDSCCDSSLGGCGSFSGSTAAGQVESFDGRGACLNSL